MVLDTRIDLSLPYLLVESIAAEGGVSSKLEIYLTHLSTYTLVQTCNISDNR